VKFKDEEIQKRFDRIMSLQVAGLADEQRPILALMTIHGSFGRTYGWQSQQVQEIIEHLLSPEMRPALRIWYERAGNNMNEVAIDFRESLCKLAGEKFGEPTT
jgi:hypothetical protein